MIKPESREVVIDTEAKAILVDKLNRCLEYQDYCCTIYVADNMDEIANFIKILYGECDDCDWVDYGNMRVLNFSNGGKIRILPFNTVFKDDTESNVIFVCEESPRADIDKCLGKRIKEYKISDTTSILTPEPIYISFKEEKEYEA